MDGRRQRNALTAAESAVHALTASEPARAAANAAKAASLDQLGLFAALPAAVATAASELEQRGAVSPAAWHAVAAALPAGPLRESVDVLRR